MVVPARAAPTVGSHFGKRFETDRIYAGEKFFILHHPFRARPVGIHLNAEAIWVNEVDCLAVEMVTGTEFDSISAQILHKAGEGVAARYEECQCQIRRL